MDKEAKARIKIIVLTGSPGNLVTRTFRINIKITIP